MKMMKKYIVLLFMSIAIVVYSHADANAWREVAVEYLNSGKPDKAIPFFKQAVSEATNSGTFRTELAFAYQMAGDYENAVLEYTAALGLGGAPVPDIKFNLANIYFHQEKWDEAILLYREAITLDEFFAQAVLNKAIAEVEVKRYRDAEDDYNRYLELKPNTPKRPEIENMLALLSQMREFPVTTVDKDKYNEKRSLEEQLNESRTRLREDASNQFLGQ